MAEHDRPPHAHALYKARGGKESAYDFFAETGESLTCKRMIRRASRRKKVAEERASRSSRGAAWLFCRPGEPIQIKTRFASIEKKLPKNALRVRRVVLLACYADLVGRSKKWVIEKMLPKGDLRPSLGAAWAFQPDLL